jgi:hypothetical protein
MYNSPPLVLVAGVTLLAAPYRETEAGVETFAIIQAFAVSVNGSLELF